VLDNRVPDDADLANLVGRLASELTRLGWTMAAAESCTGGWIAKCCTDREGSSAWFERGFVTYSDQSKQELLGVESRVLDDAGAVSREAVLQMAIGARSRAGTHLAIAVTGIAGPDGGSPEKPVGSVWFAWARQDSVEAELKQFSGDRDAVRRHSVEHALQGLIERTLA
jgi:nicotinamide-nucleotide amidase